MSEPLEATARPEPRAEQAPGSLGKPRALRARVFPDEPGLGWHQAIARMQRQVGALEEERLTAILMFATAAEGQELSARGTTPARLQEIFSECARRGDRTTEDRIGQPFRQVAQASVALNATTARMTKPR